MKSLVMLHGARVALSRSRALTKYVGTPMIRKNVDKIVMSAENFRKLSNRDLSLYINGPLCNIESLRNISLDVLVNEIRLRHELLTHKDIYRLVSGLARKNVVLNDSLLEALRVSVMTHLPQFGAHELSNMIVEMTACVRRLGADGGKIFALIAPMCEEFERKIFAATVIDLSNVTMGIADSGVSYSHTLLEKIGLSALIQMGTFKGPELCDLLSALSILGVGNDDLMCETLSHISGKIHRLWTPQLVDLMVVLVRWGYPQKLPFTVKEKLETNICLELEKRLDFPSNRFLDLLMSLTDMGILNRTPNTEERIRTFLVDQRKHDWWYSAVSLSKVIQSIDKTRICCIGKHIDYVPIDDFKCADEIASMMHYLSTTLETQLIRLKDVAYAKSLLMRLREFGWDDDEISRRFPDIPTGIWNVTEQVPMMNCDENIFSPDVDRSGLTHLEELYKALSAVVHERDGSSFQTACKISGIPVDAVVSIKTQKKAFMIVPDYHYHVYERTLCRALKPRIQRQLDQLQAMGISPVVIDSHDWRNGHHEKIVRNSFSDSM
jgi:hypothetical protein